MFHVKRGAPPALKHLEQSIGRLSELGLLREAQPLAGPGEISYCSNDYLGLAARAAPSEVGGAGGSRLLSGDRAIHRELEREAAALVDQDQALVFSSGYAANVGVLSALATAGDVVVSDELNHASIIDGARLSRAQVLVVRHCDVDAVRKALRAPRRGRAWVVTESYFSMDADSPDLAALRAVCDEAGAALVVDEAHAIGVLGPEGRGLCIGAGVQADVVVGTFGKAFGAGGAFAAGCAQLRLWLWNRARSFVFSTGLSPVAAAAALAGMRAAAETPDLRQRALRAADWTREGLSDLGLDVRGYGPILPWVLGSESRAVGVARALRGHGIHIHPVRPPSVPAGTARLRITVTALHGRNEVDRLVSAIREVA